MGKQCRPRSEAIGHGLWSVSMLFALNIEISTKDGNNETNQLLLTGNEPAQRGEVEESTWHKWINFLNEADQTLKGNGYIFREVMSKLFCIPLEKGFTIKGNKFFPFWVDPFSDWDSVLESKQEVTKVVPHVINGS